MFCSLTVKVLGTLLAFSILLCVFCPSSLADTASSDSVDSLLDIGSVVNRKMKYVPENNNPEKHQQSNIIKALRMADSLPEGFVPSESNTVSAADSPHPVYIFFDNKEDAGIMYFYTDNGKVVMNPDSSLLFSGLASLTDISGVADWDASRVISMYAIFASAKSLPDALALKNWDTSSVTDMRYMFSGASSLMYIDVSNWNTGNVISMKCMFQVGDNYKGDGQLQEILGLGNLDVSNVTDMTCMFYGAGQVQFYDVAGWDVSKVESMNHMFGDNFKLRSLDLSLWDVSSVKTIYCMFDDNYELTTIGNVSNWNTSSLIDAGGWLNGAYAFIGDNTGTLDLSRWDISNLKSIGEMFRATSLRTIDLSGWTFDGITNDPWDEAGKGIYYETGNSDGSVCGMGELFRQMKKLRTVYLSQDGMDSFNAAVENGINTEKMWSGSSITGFTVK